MAKAKDAFRTISEVAEWLDTPTHVLRFWESKFSQIKPVKGAGGRRYYRPADMELLGGIKQLLHEDGLTIKGTQKLLREKGAKHVAMLGASTTQPAPAQPEPAPATTAPTPDPVIALVQAVQAARDPSLPVQDMFPFNDTHKAPAIEIEFPALPSALPDMPGRLIGCAPTDGAAIRAKAAEIAPLLGRLEVLRDRMRSQ